MKLLNESKGQASIETLVLIAAAIMIATLVGFFLKSSLGGETQNRIANQTAGVINELGQVA